MSEARRLLNQFNEGDFDADDMELLKNKTKEAKKQDLKSKVDDIMNIMASDPGFNTPEIKMANMKRAHAWRVDQLHIAMNNDRDLYGLLVGIAKGIKRGVPREQSLNSMRNIVKIAVRRAVKAEVDWEEGDMTPEESMSHYTPAVMEDAAEEEYRRLANEVELGNYD